MSRQELEKSLGRVPFLSRLGVRVEDAAPGEIVLRLPSSQDNRNFEGTIHAGALFALGELAAAVALGTHPHLVDVEPLQKGSTVRYLGTSRKDVTAHAEVTPELVEAIREQLDSDAPAQCEVPVQILDGHGDDIAELTTVFGFRFRI